MKTFYIAALSNSKCRSFFIRVLKSVMIPMLICNSSSGRVSFAVYITINKLQGQILPCMTQHTNIGSKTGNSNRNIGIRRGGKCGNAVDALFPFYFPRDCEAESSEGIDRAETGSTDPVRAT